jgi:hypothetical protein
MTTNKTLSISFIPVVFVRRDAKPRILRKSNGITFQYGYQIVSHLGVTNFQNLNFGAYISKCKAFS